MRYKYFIGYLVVGIINTLVGYSIIFLLLYIGLIPEISNLTGYVIGILVSFFLNKNFNFKSRGKIRKELPKFVTSMGIAYILNLAAMSYSYRVLGIDKYLAQVFGGSFYVITGYTLSRFWVFDIEK